MVPEKIHLALNHLTFLMAVAAILPLSVGLIWRSRAALVCGLLLALVAGSSTGLVMKTGEEAYERYEDGVAMQVSDAELHEHEERAHQFSKIMYALGAASFVCLLCVWLKPGWVSACAVVVLVLCVLSFASGLYIANAGGKIVRPHFINAEDAIYKDGYDHDAHDHDGHDDHDY